MPPTITESIVEEAILDWFRELGYAVAFGPELAPDEPAARLKPLLQKQYRNRGFSRCFDSKASGVKALAGRT